MAQRASEAGCFVKLLKVGRAWEGLVGKKERKEVGEREKKKGENVNNW